MFLASASEGSRHYPGIKMTHIRRVRQVWSVLSLYLSSLTAAHATVMVKIVSSVIDQHFNVFHKLRVMAHTSHLVSLPDRLWFQIFVYFCLVYNGCQTYLPGT